MPCRLAADSWDRSITARRGERPSALADQLSGKHAVSAQTYAADLTDPRDVDELAVIIAAERDLLVNNARFAWYREFCDVAPGMDILHCAAHRPPGACLRQCPISCTAGVSAGGICPP